MDWMTWWGTATCTYELDGVRLLTDPVLAEPGTTFTLEAPLTGRPLRYRNLDGTAAVESSLSGVDVILLSHDHHGDNFDDGGRRVARTAARVLTTVVGAKRLRKAGLEHAIGLLPWQSYVLNDERGALLRITATPARHGPLGTNWFAGPVIGFVIERLRGGREKGRGRIYVSGDTRFFDGVPKVRQKLGPIELAVLHLGAARFGPRSLRNWLRFSMDARDATHTVRALQPNRVVPIHFEGWSHFTEDAHSVNAHFEAAGIAPSVRWLTRGKRVALGALQDGSADDR